MDALSISLNYNDPLWIMIALLLGLGARQLNLPPLVGFLVAGFLLNLTGAEGGAFLSDIANLGITLLLFSIGLKLNIGQLLRNEVWGIAGTHMLLIVLVNTLLVLGLAKLSLPLFSGIDFTTAALIGFALSFSSTVFAVKVLEEKGDMVSRHGKLAIGILIMQDIAAVLFLAISTGKLPSPWALGLLLLLPLRPLLFRLLKQAGHDELLILFGFVLALGGAALFESVGIKGDLGALLLGLMLSGHPKTDELSKTLLGFKELFLIGFFLSIGLTGLPNTTILLASLLLLAALPVKTVLYFWLATRFKIRARTATLTSLHLSNYSEFGLIVGAIAVTNGWLANDWLVLIAVALSFSFMLGAPLNREADTLFTRFHDFLVRFETEKRLSDDLPVTFSGAKIAIIGMGRVGTGAYDHLKSVCGDSLIGIDFDSDIVAQQIQAGRRVIQGDATDPDFFNRVERHTNTVELVLVTMPNHTSNLTVVKQLQQHKFTGHIAATAKYADEVGDFTALGIESAYNIYAEAGSGFAGHILNQIQCDNLTDSDRK
jgi:glutathione-regulated potassium-efflux system ancillary protein KefC